MKYALILSKIDRICKICKLQFLIIKRALVKLRCLAWSPINREPVEQYETPTTSEAYILLYRYVVIHEVLHSCAISCVNKDSQILFLFMTHKVNDYFYFYQP